MHLHQKFTKSIERTPIIDFETYGMTETVSHIAAKNLSKGERVFTILPDISIAVDAMIAYGQSSKTNFGSFVHK